ncbi:MAG TPA: (d)CMP kinase [Actinomycetota bacterium]|nr:(d)CMP kinase [Actinomycetota bacterium]
MTVIAIDGPAGAGKSSVARAVAAALSFSYLDTGALYRAMALAVLEEAISPEDERAVAAVASRVEVRVRGDRTILNGRDVSDRIRDEDVTMIVSLISSYPAVRQRLLQLQKEMLMGGDIVIEGRDIGTRVAPDADLKIYLTATLEQRAARRAGQTGGLGVGEPARIEKDLESRDRADAGRLESPLVQAPDSLAIDSTSLSFDEVVERILVLARGRNR